jgi:hypothetical protein
MGSIFEELAALGAAALIEHHGERDRDGLFEHVVISLPSGLITTWRCAVHELTQRYVEENGSVVAREACELRGLTSELVTGAVPLARRTGVFVPRYAPGEFQVDPETSRWGGPMTVMALLRTPFVRMNDLHAKSI